MIAAEIQKKIGRGNNAAAAFTDHGIVGALLIAAIADSAVGLYRDIRML